MALTKDNLQTTLVIASFVCMSLFMNFFNKEFFTKLGNQQFSLLTMQAAFSFFLIYILKDSFIADRIPLFKVPSFQLTKLKKASYLAFSYVGHLVLSLLAIRLLSVTMYSLFKRTTPVMLLIMEAILLQKRHPFPLVLSVLVIVAGATITSWKNPAIDTVGLVVSILACVLKATYALSVQMIGYRPSTNTPEGDNKNENRINTRRDNQVPEKEMEPGTQVKFSSMELIFYNSLLCLPVLIILSIIFDDYTELNLSLILYSPITMAAISFFLLEGMVHQILFYGSTLLSSALTTNLAGHMKVPLTMVIDFILFKHPLTLNTTLGAFCILSGALLYSYLKISYSNQRKEESNEERRSQYKNSSANV